MEKKRKYKLYTSLTAIGLAATIAVTGFSLNSKNKNKDELADNQNQIGYEDYSIGFNSEDFILFDVGDNDSIGTYKQDKKMKKCNKKDISFGVVIDSSATTQDEIYKDADYAKKIVQEYEVNFPVYLNVDQIIESDSIMPEVKVKLIYDFLQKLENNNIFAGIAGKDSSLVRLSEISKDIEYFDVNLYQVFLTKEDDEIKFTGNYTIIKDGKEIKNLNKSYNCDPIIKRRNDDSKKSLNDAKEFMFDYQYEIKEESDIEMLADKYKFSVQELLDYNNLRRKDLKEGTIINIPSKQVKSIDKKEPEAESPNNQDFAKLDEPLIGCDISNHQSFNEEDFIKLSKTINYFILKSNEGLLQDKKFQEYYGYCIKNGIPVGAYMFNATNHNEDFEVFKKEAKKRSEFAMSILENKSFEYPLYLDLENTYNKSGQIVINLSTFTSKEIVFLIEDWINKVESIDQVPGLYVNDYTWNNIVLPALKKENKENLLNKMQTWVAGRLDDSTNYYGNVQSLDSIKAKAKEYQTDTVDIRQITEHGSLKSLGISQNIDIDLCYKDYEGEKVVVEEESYADDTLEDFDPELKRDFKQKLYDKSGLFGSIAAALGAVYIYRRKKKNDKNK